MLHSQIINLPVGVLEERARRGTVRRVVVSPDDGAVIGLVISTGLGSWSKKAVSWQDIVELDRHGVVVNSQENLLPMSEIVRLDELVGTGFNLLGLPVVTAAEERLGKVADYEIDPTSGALTKIHVKKTWGQNRIVSRSKIIRFEKDKIVVRNHEGVRSLAAGDKKMAEA